MPEYRKLKWRPLRNRNISNQRDSIWSGNQFLHSFNNRRWNVFEKWNAYDAATVEAQSEESQRTQLKKFLGRWIEWISHIR